MMFPVPQFIDVEDKIVGPLSAKQLLWVAVGGVFLLIEWSVFEKTYFYVAAFFTVPIFAALAFIRPQNRQLFAFVMDFFFFLFRPKYYTWYREEDNFGITAVSSKYNDPRGFVSGDRETKKEKQKLEYGMVKDLARVLDSRADIDNRLGVIIRKH